MTYWDEDNIHYYQSLTVWGDTISAQHRGYEGEFLQIYHLPDRPVEALTRNQRLFNLTKRDAKLLRDLLNAATERGYLEA